VGQIEGGLAKALSTQLQFKFCVEMRRTEENSAAEAVEPELLLGPSHGEQLVPVYEPNQGHCLLKNQCSLEVY
jgi:hypothetical protein